MSNLWIGNRVLQLLWGVQVSEISDKSDLVGVDGGKMMIWKWEKLKEMMDNNTELGFMNKVSYMIVWLIESSLQLAISNDLMKKVQNSNQEQSSSETDTNKNLIEEKYAHLISSIVHLNPSIQV